VGKYKINDAPLVSQVKPVAANTCIRSGVLAEYDRQNSNSSLRNLNQRVMRVSEGDSQNRVTLNSYNKKSSKHRQQGPNRQ